MGIWERKADFLHNFHFTFLLDLDLVLGTWLPLSLSFSTLNLSIADTFFPFWVESWSMIGKKFPILSSSSSFVISQSHTQKTLPYLSFLYFHGSCCHGVLMEDWGKSRMGCQTWTIIHFLFLSSNFLHFLSSSSEPFITFHYILNLLDFRFLYHSCSVQGVSDWMDYFLVTLASGCNPGSRIFSSSLYFSHGLENFLATLCGSHLLQSGTTITASLIYDLSLCR